MPLPTLTAWIMLAALAIYSLLAGADFGAGVWDLFATGPRKREQRELIAHAIAPVWEANHVWLILIVVLMFAGFPRAFAAMMTALHIPVSLMLIGIVLRGCAFTFRAYDTQRPDAGPAQRRRGRVFAISSIITPILLGITLAACASGHLHWNEEGAYTSGFFHPWLADPFCWSAGLFTLSIFAFLAAVYLCVESESPAHSDRSSSSVSSPSLRRSVASSLPPPPHRPSVAPSLRPSPLQSDFRLRALLAGISVGLFAALTWYLGLHAGADLLSRNLASSRWSLPLQLATGACAITALAALWLRRFHLARLAAAAQTTLIILGYALATFPYLIVPKFTIENSSAPPETHRLLLISLAAGSVILLPSLWFLFRVFKSRDSGATPHDSGATARL